MYLFYIFCALLCVTSALTLVTRKDKKSDRDIESVNNSSSTTVDNALKGQLQNYSEFSPKTKVSEEEIKKLNISNMIQPVLEGGGKVDHATALLSIKQPDPPEISQEASSSSTSSTTKEGIQTEREAKVSARKEVDSLTEQVRTNIKARKGVGNESTSTETNLSREDNKNYYKINSSSIEPHVSKQIEKEISTQTAVTQSNTTSKNVSSVTEAPLKVSTVKVKKHKLKPTVTIGGSNVDEPIPASPTKTPPLGMPRKIDYIVPVMITILALPLLGTATYVLYRRGRDCWDKRHYRRMDFLIDGMYNE